MLLFADLRLMCSLMKSGSTVAAWEMSVLIDMSQKPTSLGSAKMSGTFLNDLGLFHERVVAALVELLDAMDDFMF